MCDKDLWVRFTFYPPPPTTSSSHNVPLQQLPQQTSTMTTRLVVPCWSRHRLCFLLLLQLNLLIYYAESWTNQSPVTARATERRRQQRGLFSLSRWHPRVVHGHNSNTMIRPLTFPSSSSSSSYSSLLVLSAMTGGSNSGGGGGDSALSTTRVPLTRIFNGEREYLFTTQRNVRSFEWTISELEDLFESILSIDGESIEELELNAITILPATARILSETDQKDIGRTSQIYDVHDGQQRLVSLSVILAALRDKLIEWGDMYELDALEVSRAIFPLKPRLKPVSRIRLREKNSKLLTHILTKRDDSLDQSYEILNLPKSSSRKYLEKSDRLIVEAYEYFASRLDELGPNKSLDLLENFMSRTYLLICIPSNTKIARSIVMGLGKGKNLEPVDEFKGMVCFLNIKEEVIQDETLDKWNKLCEEVGRKVVESTCLLLAQIFLQRRLQRNGEMDIMEDFLKQYMDQHPNCDGSTFFEETIVPVSKTLKNFYDGQIILRGGGGGKPPNQHHPSLSFLRGATRIATCKEIELVVLDLLLQWQSTMDQDEMVILEQKLRKLESIALWMMLTKPKPATRIKRCLDIIRHGKDNNNHDGDVSSSSLSSSSTGPSPLALTVEENFLTFTKVKENEFGSSNTGIKIARVILERLNEYSLIESSQGRVSPIEATLQVEHVLPRKFDTIDEWTKLWNPVTAGIWIHRLGNLALLNQKVNAKISNGPFHSKKNHLSDSPYPLTRQISKHKVWDPEAVQLHHEYVSGLAISVWGLDDKML